MTLDAANLLTAWERGAAQSSAVRALLLLEAAEPRADPECLAAMSIGERDAQLMALRERWLGPDVDCLDHCPRCGEPIELSFALEQRMAELDPQAEVLLDVQCPNCGRRSLAPFEIEHYLWSELDTWARELLHDVHRLAGAYGWREADVLALSPLRRRAYLDLIG